MKRIMVLSLLAALPAASMLVLSPTPASAFGWCSSYSTSRAVVAPRARVYGYTAIRPYRVQARDYRPVVRRRL